MIDCSPPSSGELFLEPMMYVSQLHDPDIFADIVEKAVQCLQNIAFDTIVFRGFSGAVVGPTVALRLGIPWVLVRKTGDNTHSSRMIEGNVTGDYIIIDDFIDTGDTIDKIINACGSKCVGVYLYDYQLNAGRIDRVKILNSGEFR